MGRKRQLGDRQRDAARAAWGERPPTVGHGVGPDDQAYRGAVLPGTPDLDRLFVDSNLREEAERDISPATRREVYARSDGVCESRCSPHCSGVGTSLHHRKLRRWGDHTAANLIHVCPWCHEAIHRLHGLAMARGLILHSTDDSMKTGWTPGVLVG